MPKISVITPTIRPEGLMAVDKAMRRQEETDFEWLIASPFQPETKHPHVWVNDDFTGGYWSLNRVYNKAIRQAVGSLIVSWQDHTFANADALSKFLFYHERYPKALIGGIGHKYDGLEPSLGPEVWHDPRDNGSYNFEECKNWMDLEYNYAAIPKAAFIDCGGWDEQMDFEGFGYDGISVSDRLSMLGWEFYLDRANRSYSETHGRPKGWDEKNMGHTYREYRKRYLENPRLNYLP